MKNEEFAASNENSSFSREAGILHSSFFIKKVLHFISYPNDPSLPVSSSSGLVTVPVPPVPLPSTV